MSINDTAAGGHYGGPDPFADLKGLIAVITNPEAAQAQADAFQAQRADIAGERKTLAADRETFAREKAKALAEIAEARASAGRMMTNAYEEKQAIQTFRELAEAFAERVGYRERPSVETVGFGELTRTVSIDEPVPDPSNSEPSTSRISEERFGQTTLTRHVDDEAAPSSPATVFRGTKPRRGA